MVARNQSVVLDHNENVWRVQAHTKQGKRIDSHAFIFEITYSIYSRGS